MSDKTNSLETLATNIKNGVDTRLKELHTSMPGIVQSFDAVNQLATVQPAVRRVFITQNDDNTELLTPTDLPILINVPVIFPRGGGFSLTFPVAKGDECLLVFCERSIDDWHQYGTVRTPSARRFHSLSDAVAFVGMSSIPNKIPNYDPVNIELKKDDDSVSLKLFTDGTATLKTNTKITLETPDVTITGNLEVQGDTALSSNVTSSGTDISNSHTHTGSPSAPMGGISDTGVPT